MEILRALVALSIVGSVIVFWFYKSRHFLLQTPFFASLVISLLHLSCAYWIYFKSSGFWEVFMAYGLAQLASRPVHSVLNRLDLTLEQNRRDRKAVEIFDSGLAVPFALYLRPFKTTDRLNLSGLSTKWGGIDLESLIANACSPWGPLLGLGRKGDAVGAGKLCSSDDDWKAMFFQLSEAASAIIVVPGVNGGTFFEIESIINRGLLGKTTFLMPPAFELPIFQRSPILALVTGHGPPESDYARNWENVRACLQTMGIRLPPYNQGGSLIQFCGTEGSFSQYKFERGLPSVQQVLAERLSHPAL